MLSLIASGLVLVGMLLLLLGGISFLISAFRESGLWGLAVLFLPLAPLVFLVLHWDRGKDAFFLQLYGLGFVIVAVMLSHNGLPWPLH